MQAVDQPTWQLILIAVKKLNASFGDFRLGEIIKEVQLLNPHLDRTSIQPVVQGMTSNAGKGPPSPCGQPLVRVSHGIYRLMGDIEKVNPTRDLTVKLTPRIAHLETPKRIKVKNQENLESLDRGHLEFQEGQEGVSYDYLFGPYVRDARQVTVIDPYIRQFNQVKSVMEFIETVRKFNSDDSVVSVKLITIEDEDSEKAAKQRDLLNQVKISADAAGIEFSFQFDESRTLHDREVSTDSGWKIVLGRGLGIYQHISNDAFGKANSIQSLRKVKKFGISYIETASTQGPKPEVSPARLTPTKAKSRVVIAKQNATELVNADIVLIACVKTKLVQAAAAKDLFISSLFRKERAYAESTGVPWYILSAEHGLIAPEQWVEPYDRYLGDESTTYRKAWGSKVVADLERIEGPLQGKVIEIHAGAPYFEAIQAGLQFHGAVISDPLNGLRFGERLRWYSIGTFAQQPGLKPISNDPLPEIKFLVASLSDESMAVSPNNFLSAGRVGRKVPGMYSWWVDANGAQELSKELDHRIETGLIYVGLAGATHWPSGKRSSNTLWSRIQSMHLGAKHEFSTLRQTIGAILANADGSRVIDENALTRWMELHLRVQVVPYEDGDSLGRVEQAILAELDPPLNLKGMSDTALRRQLKELRRAVTE